MIETYLTDQGFVERSDAFVTTSYVKDDLHVAVLRTQHVIVFHAGFVDESRFVFTYQAVPEDGDIGEFLEKLQQLREIEKAPSRR